MANEKRLIDANALVSYLWVLFKYFGSLPCSEADKTTQRAIKRCIGEVKKMPTVDAVEVVHGRWEWMTEDMYNCTYCGAINHVKEVMGRPDFNYCPNCGAKMDGDGNG